MSLLINRIQAKSSVLFQKFFVKNLLTKDVSLVKQLEELHRQHLLLSFEDTVAHEQSIEVLTQDITQVAQVVI